MAKTNINEDDSNIGVRIREQRKARSLSLSELAQKTGVTTSFLSQVERGLVSTSISSLRKISEALGVSILYFLNDTPKHDPVIRAGKRLQITLPGLSSIVYEVIAANLANVEVFLGHLKPGMIYQAYPLRSPTEECVYVLSGALIVELERQVFTLSAGDSITFEGISLKRFSCESGEETTWLAIITPPAF